MNDFFEHFKEVREQTRKELNKRRGIDEQHPSSHPSPMNKLPLSPTDVTEFTCEDAAYWALCDNMRGNSTQGRNAIRAEWSHRIAVEGARLARIPTLEESVEFFEACRAYVAWLDSLKSDADAEAAQQAAWQAEADLHAMYSAPGYQP